MTGTSELRGLIAQAETYEHATTTMATAVDYLCMQLFDEEAAHWKEVNGKPEDSEVPFAEDNILRQKWGPDGWIIPRLPELESGVWYEHDINVNRATGPAAFMQDDVKVEWFSRANGEEDQPIELGSIDWSQVRRYRKFEPLDEAIAGFGFF